MSTGGKKSPGSWVEFIVDVNKRTIYARAGGDKRCQARGWSNYEETKDHKGSKRSEGVEVYEIPESVKAIVPAMSSRANNVLEIELIDANIGL